MNKTLSSLVAATTMLIAAPTIANATSVTVGYQQWSLATPIVFQHTTHPDDSFLIGSPGTTQVDSASALFFDIEGSKRSGAFEPYFGAGLDLYVSKKDMHQNDNDPRPAANGAFVYSKVAPFGAHVNAGVRIFPVKTSGFFLDAALSGATFGVESGWDRYSKEQVERKTNSTLGLFGGGIGWKDEGMTIVGKYQRATNKASVVTLSCGYNF